MHPHRVPLHSYPPLNAQDKSIFGGFSPIREHKSSPDPPVHSTTVTASSCTPSHCGSSAIPESSPPQLRKGLGSRDIRNNMTIRHTKNDSPDPSPLKRGWSVSLDTNDICRLKRHHLTSVYEDDMDWIKREIKDIREETKDIREETKDIKAWMIELKEFFKEEVNFRIGEILYQLEQMN